MKLSHTFTINRDHGPWDYLVWYLSDDYTVGMGYLLHAITAEATGNQRDCAAAFADTRVEWVHHCTLIPCLSLNQMRGQPFPVPVFTLSFDSIRLDISQVKINDEVKVTLMLDLEEFPITG